jgi:hypothetical protein
MDSRAAVVSEAPPRPSGPPSWAQFVIWLDGKNTRNYANDKFELIVIPAEVTREEERRVRQLLAVRNAARELAVRAHLGVSVIKVSLLPCADSRFAGGPSLHEAVARDHYQLPHLHFRRWQRAIAVSTMPAAECCTCTFGGGSSPDKSENPAPDWQLTDEPAGQMFAAGCA